MLKRMLAVVSVCVVAAVSADALKASDWVLLGKKKVGTKLDRDEIKVGMSEGAFRHIRLSVHDRGVEFHKVRVVFASGEPFDVEIKSYIPAGQQTRVIDLPGKARYIRKVVLWYETRSGSSKEATVAVWGRED